MYECGLYTACTQYVGISVHSTQIRSCAQGKSEMQRTVINITAVSEAERLCINLHSNA